jgi:hypothetical protein
MLVEPILVILAAVNAWFGWKRNLRVGLAIAFGVPLVLSLVAARFIPIPSEAGGLWMFAIAFVVLTGVSLTAFWAAYAMRQLYSGRERRR